MKAIVVREFGWPEVMRLEEVPAPTPGPGQVTIRVHAAGVNPVDAYIRSGTYARKPTLPYTPGTDIAGTVASVGQNVTRVAPGDRVYAHAAIGGYAEVALCEDWQAHALPERLSFSQGAALGVPYATAWRALFVRAHAKAGDIVLVSGGTGGVGTAAIQIARGHGLQVIATAGTDAGAALIKELGAHHVLNHRHAGYLQQVPALTAGHGVDVVLEMLANVNLDQDLDVLALGGRVVVIGNRGRVEIDPRKAMAKDAAILGMTLFNATRAEFHEIHSGLGAGLENGTLTPVVAREMPLGDAATSHKAVMEPGALGKIVLIP
ncbi:MAG TPA: NADPH:quinone reductase [Vicinamibacterales bacterium]